MIIKVAFPGFGFSHDRTNAELAQKKKYDALKQQLNEKEAAGESGWKIRNGKSGLELVKINPFRGGNM